MCRPQSGEPSEEMPAVAATVTPPAQQKIQTDPFGHPLAGDLVDVFEHRSAILSMVAELEDDKNRIKKLREHHGGEFIPWQLIEHQLSNSQRVLEAAAPQAVCPDCGGANPQRAVCRTCDGAGFVGAGKFTHSHRSCKRRRRRFSFVG